MPKTLKDYLLEGGLKGRKFIHDEDFYEVENIIGDGYAAYMTVISRRIKDPFPGIRHSVPFGDRLNDVEYEEPKPK